MSRNKLLLILIFSTYWIKELWQLFPFSERLLTPFPLSDQQITFQSYVYYASFYAIWVIVFYVLADLFLEYRQVMLMFLYFQIFEFLEYFITYNEAWFYIFVGESRLPVNLTLVKCAVMSVVVIQKLFHDGHNDN